MAFELDLETGFGRAQADHLIGVDAAGIPDAGETPSSARPAARPVG
jgi:hypothetical protein